MPAILISPMRESLSSSCPNVGLAVHAYKACIFISVPCMQLVSMAVTRWLCPCVLGMESPLSEASTAAATGWTTQKDAMAMPGELDELLMVSAGLISVNLNLPCISCGRISELAFFH